MPLFGKKNYSTVKIRKRDIPNGLWVKCPSCTEIVFKQELEAKSNVCPKCGYHFQIGRMDRLRLLTEEGSFEEWDADLYSVDTLGFTGTERRVGVRATPPRPGGSRAGSPTTAARS